MAKVVSIEWDSQEIRLAAGSAHGATVRVDALQAVPLQIEGDANEELIQERVKAALQSFVSSIGSKPEVVVSAQRANFEMRTLSLPPASDDELPDMARFAAQRSFAQIGDSWPLDFTKLPATGDQQNILAAAMNPVALVRARKMCESCGASLSKVLVRSLASAALAKAHHAPLQSASALVVNVIGDDADLIALQQGTAVLMRTARLPNGDDNVRETALASEIRRTRMAAESNTPPVKVDQLVMWGQAGMGQPGLSKLSQHANLPVVVLDLRQAVDLRVPAAQMPPGDLDRFAPVVGMIRQSQHVDHNTIDFANPRKRKEKQKPVRALALSAAAALVLLGGGFWWYWKTHRDLDQSIVALQAKSKSMDQNLESSRKLSKDLTKVVNFLQGDIQWLDELEILSNNALTPEQLRFDTKSVRMGIVTDGGRSGAVRGFFRSPMATVKADQITEFEANMQAAGRVSTTPNKTQMNDEKSIYFWMANPADIRIPGVADSAVRSDISKPRRKRETPTPSESAPAAKNQEETKEPQEPAPKT